MMRIQIELTEQQIMDLKRLAVKQRTSVAELIRRSIDRMLIAERATDSDIKARAIVAIGQLHSKTGDLSTLHNDYAFDK